MASVSTSTASCMTGATYARMPEVREEIVEDLQGLPSDVRVAQAKKNQELRFAQHQATVQQANCVAKRLFLAGMFFLAVTVALPILFSGYVGRIKEEILVEVLMGTLGSIATIALFIFALIKRQAEFTRAQLNEALQDRLRHYFYRGGPPEDMRELLKMGVELPTLHKALALLSDVNWRQEDSCNHLKDLIIYGADLRGVNSTGQRVIHCLAERYESLLPTLLAQGNVDVNAQDSKGNTALLVAAISFRLGAIETLLLNNADASITNAHRESALHFMAKCVDRTGNNSRIVRKLLERGAPIDAEDATGKTPLVTAIWHGQRKGYVNGSTLWFVEELIRGRANLNQPMSVVEGLPLAQRATDITPLGLGCLFGSDESAAALLRAGADHTRAESFLGRTPLHFAVANKMTAVVNSIVTKDPSAKVVKDKDGVTPFRMELHQASSPPIA